MSVTIHFSEQDPMRLATEYWWSCECGQSAPFRRKEFTHAAGEALDHVRVCRYLDGDPPSDDTLVL